MREPAEQDGSAHVRAGVDPGRAASRAAQLPWLAPSADSLAALARTPGAAAWPLLRHDPGAVLLLLRAAPATTSLLPFPDALLQGPAPLEEALRLLDAGAGFVDWDQPATRPIYQAALAAAWRAEALAGPRGIDPTKAWLCALLAPLGWLALCAVDPEGTATSLVSPEPARHPPAPAPRPGRLDQDRIARRLARRWGLPAWLSGVIGALGLPAGAALALGLGADPLLLAVARTAWRQGPGHAHGLGLVGLDHRAEDEAALGGPTEAPTLAAIAPIHWQAPHSAPLLRDLLVLAIENRRHRHEALFGALEREVDEFHRTLEERACGEEERLQTAKLTALAELAAGAGHEINNPLAVISGQAQYLLGHEADWFTGDTEKETARALHNIIAQTKRVHSLLRDLMLFARPAAPRPAWADLPTLLGEVAASLGELAQQRQVRVEVAPAPDRFPVYLDAEQVRTALVCLLRNAIEAVPPAGWARLVLLGPAGGMVEVAVEDSGPGPAAGLHAALFDPFYSGRSAGRGRGMGLPVAWRLARQQGGDLRLDPARPVGPTRFVLALPYELPPGRERPDGTGATERHAA